MGWWPCNTCLAPDAASRLQVVGTLPDWRCTVDGAALGQRSAHFSLLSTCWLLHPAPTDRFRKMLIAPNRSARSIASREVEETPLSFDNSDNWRKFELVWQQVHNQPLFLKLLQSLSIEYFHHTGLVKNCVATIVTKQCEVLPTRPNKWMTCSGQRFYDGSFLSTAAWLVAM